MDLLIAVLIFIAFCFWSWLKYKMNVSKARFALTSLASIVVCFSGGMALILSGSLQDRIISIILFILNDFFGAGIVVSSGQKINSSVTIVAIFANCLGMILLYQLSSVALRNWEGPETVMVHELARRSQDNYLIPLAKAELVRILAEQTDPPISEAAVNWQQQSPRAPNAPAWVEFCRELYTTRYAGSVEIPENGWRPKNGAWTGVLYGVSDIKDEILLFPLPGDPSESELKRVVDCWQELDFLGRFVLVGVFDSDETVCDAKWFVAGHQFEVWTRHSLLVSGLKLESYARDLVRRFESEVLGGTDKTLLNTFTPTHVTKGNGTERLLLDQVISEWECDKSRRQIALVGEYGQGKSTAMLEWCTRWAREFLANGSVDRRVPLLIELRGKSPADSDSFSFIAPWAGRFGIEPNMLMNLVKSGRALLIFEGFDELRNAGKAFERHEHFNALWGMSYPGTKIIFTGRPNFFLDEAEKNRTLRKGGEYAFAGSPYTELLEISRLTRDEIIKIASGFSENFSRGIADLILQNSEFFDIMSRPSMLPVIATIWPELLGHQQLGKSVTNAIMIEKYLTSMLYRKDAEVERFRISNSDAHSYLTLPTRARDFFALHVVWRMACLGLQNTIERKQFDLAIRDAYPLVIRGLLSNSSDPSVVFGIRRFQERYRDETDDDRVSIVANEVASAGLFVSDPAAGVSNLRLPHKQFFEYLIAKAIWFQLRFPDSQTAQSLRQLNMQRDPFSVLESNSNATNFLFQLDGGRFVGFRDPSFRIALAFFEFVSALIESKFIRSQIRSRSGSKSLRIRVRKDSLSIVLYDRGKFDREIVGFSAGMALSSAGSGLALGLILANLSFVYLLIGWGLGAVGALTGVFLARSNISRRARVFFDFVSMQNSSQIAASDSVVEVLRTGRRLLNDGVPGEERPDDVKPYC